MIIFIMICTVILLGVAQFISRRENLRRLYVEFSADSTLTEPDESVTLRFTVHNTGRWPVLYAGLSLQLDPEVLICEDEEWMSRHANRDFLGTRIDFHFYLLPYRKFSGKIRIAFRERGVYELGRYYLERGDFLGLNPVIVSGFPDVRIVCTSRRCELPELQTFGGYLGDVPVQRFILDDPSMLKGYREYTGREPMKQISWMQTAKTGQLTVRQNDFTVDRNVSILVNMESAPLPVLEHCMELLRSVCEELEEQHVPYALYSNGDLFSVNEGLGRSHVFYIQRRIGLSRLGAIYSFTRLVDRYVRHPRENSSCIIITPVRSEAVEASLPRLRRCSCRDPHVLCGGEKNQ
ncbi:MAG: DUF58 domain-containing protein [Oscillospiraceae bacterium]|nr:DUF58 domain-containing protein [Oscillospiraceae bacterium]